MKSQALNQSALLLKILGHVKRLEIACLLHGHELTVNQIAQMTGLRQAGVSQHLITLKHAKLVISSPRGKEIYYTLNDRAFYTLSLFLDGFTKSQPLADEEPRVTDPICGMSLTPSRARYTQTYDGILHYFCAKGCLTQFIHLHRGKV